MARHLFTLLSAASLLLCVATCVLWVRSYADEDDSWRPFGNQFEVVSTYGLLGFAWGRLRILSSDDVTRWGDFGFRPGDPVVAFVPHWAAMLAAFAIALAPWVWRSWYRHHLVIVGRCPTCGYDLYASPGQCPECGAEPTASAAKGDA